MDERSTHDSVHSLQLKEERRQLPPFVKNTSAKTMIEEEQIEIRHISMEKMYRGNKKREEQTYENGECNK